MRNYFRDTYAIINLDFLEHNIKTIKNTFLKDDLLYAVIKANGYGHGACQIAMSCIEAGANKLAVATLDEAIELRKANIEIDILVLGPSRVEDLALASKFNITVTCPNLEWAQKASKSAVVPVKIHVKMDTGMCRIGLAGLEELVSALAVFKENIHIVVEGIYTHFATAEDDEAYFLHQVEEFKKIVENINFKFKYIHAANSAAIIKYLPLLTFCNAHRLGISMYGYGCTKDTSINLKPTLELYSHITQIRKVKAGTLVGYGSTYKTKDEYIATLSYGYADGMFRRQSICPVSIDSKQYKIAGRICMDQMMIALDENYPVGTQVGIITQSHTAQTIADLTDTIPHEVLCAISKRVVKFYIKDDKIIDCVNDLAF